MTRKFKIIFFSEVNSKFGMPFFKKIVAHKNFEVVAFVTTPQGKLCSYYVGESEPVDLASYALAQKIPVYRPQEIKSDTFLETLKQYQPDYLLIANYQKILPEKLIALPKYNTLNFHPSPLPRYAGLEPFFWMARNSETQSGVSCIKVAPLIDGGDIVAQFPVKLTGNETSLEIREKLFARSLELLDHVLDQIITGNIQTSPQNIAAREYFSRPTERDITITPKTTVAEACAILRACAPNAGRLQLTDRCLRVTALSWAPGPERILYQLADGKIYFLLNEANLYDK